MELLVTPGAMGEADRRTIASGTPVEVLMERAGRAVAWEVRRVLGSVRGCRVVIVCGKGNNGGDGLVTARALRQWGARVAVFELAAAGKVDPPLTRFHTADAPRGLQDMLERAVTGKVVVVHHA